MQQLQITFQKTNEKHQIIKRRNKKLKKQINSLRNEIKIRRDDFFSKFENEKKNKNNQLKLKLEKQKIIKNDRIFKYFELFTLTDDKKFFYEN